MNADILTLARELADLTPVELDKYVLEHPVKFTYPSSLYAVDLENLAAEVLEHESIGDAMARVHQCYGA